MRNFASVPSPASRASLLRLFIGLLSLLSYPATLNATPVPVAPRVVCTPGHPNGCNGSATIKKVEITGTTLSNVSTCQVDNFGNAYSVFAPTGAATATVQQGVSYRFGVTTGTSSIYLSAWIDWNQDGFFASSEYISIATNSTANVPRYLTLTVPSGALLGATTLRIRSRTISISSTESCTSFGSGEAQDYTLTVAAAPTPAPAYCTPVNVLGDCATTIITKVEITGTTLSNVSTCQTDALNNAYTIFAPTGAATATVQQGVSYRFGATSNSSSIYLSAWIDWNHDDFFATSEYVTLSTNSSANSPSYITLAVPSGALLGSTVLRVRSRSVSISSTESCAAFGSGETEDYTLTVAAAPSPAPAYCTPVNVLSGCGNSIITKVEITGTSLGNVSTCQTDALNNAYTIFAPTGAATATVQQGVSYRFGVTSNSSSIYLSAWIDWNHDGFFANSEYVTLSTNSIANGPAYITLPVPSGALLGATVLRVRSRSVSISSTESCAAFGSGETEDYTLTVAAAPTPAPAYCVPANFLGDCATSIITRVQLTGSGLNNASTCQTTSFGNAYTIFPATGSATGNVQPGTGYSLGVTTGTSGAYLAAWVDWNHDGFFANSEFAVITSNATVNTPAFITLAVPTGAVQGPTVLRVRSRSVSIGSNESCAAFGSGETEDYTLFVGNCALAAPTISAGSVCAGGTLTLTASGVPPNAGYQWSGPNGFSSTQPSPQIQNAQATSNGTYLLTITSAGCSATSVGLNVAVSPPPTVTISASRPLALCPGQSVTLTANGANTYVWSTGATTPSITVSAAGTYSATGTSAPGCPSAAPTSVSVTVGAAPTAGISASGPTTFCAGGSVTLTASGGTSYVWSTGATAPTITVTTGGTYSVTATNAAGCSAASTPTTVTVTPAPSAAFAYAASTYCLSGATPTPAISGASGGTFSATPAGLSLNATTGALNLAASQAGTYTITYAVGGACPATATQTVTLTTAPLAAFSYQSGPRCARTSGTVAPTLTTGASAGTFSATPAGLTLNAATGVINLAASQPGTYTITNAIAASGACAAATATATITLSAAPTAGISASGPTTFCAGGSVTLTASGGTSYVWSTGATAPTITVTTGGTYSVTATNAAGCSAASTPTTVTVTPAPSAAFAYAASTYCLSGATPTPAISGASGGTFSATPAGLSLNATTGALNLAASQAGTYTITYAVGGACPATATQTVTLTTAPLAAFSYQSGPRCARTSGTVAPTLTTGASAGTFSATPAGLTLNAATGVINLATSSAGMYTVTNVVSGGAGCAPATATTTVTLGTTPPAPTITVQPQGSTVVLTSSALTGNQWYVGGQPIAGATGPTYTATQNGTYTVVSTVGGCSSGISAPQTVVILGLAAEVAAVRAELHPNPTTGRVMLTLNNWAQSGTLTLHDLAGRTVWQADVPAHTTQQELDVQALPTGYYLLRLVGADGRAVIRRLARE